MSKNGIEADSIFNAARDNAIGTSALICVAQYFLKFPPKRSVLLIGFGAEEIGLFGSDYCANNPLVPLKNCVYYLNIDNAGYNDTKNITMYGNSRTNIDSLVVRSLNKFGLGASTDPSPEENFLERSDQFSFIQKGIPAMQFGMGMTAYDDAIKKYYHQVNDDVSSLDMSYT